MTLDAGAYNVTESGPSGYTASFSADCSGSIANGQTKTCTVTNDDQAAKLIVIKHVINDNGGTATAANFTLDSGGANDSPDDFAGAESPGTEHARRRLPTTLPSLVHQATPPASRLTARLDRQRPDQDLHGHQRRSGSKADRDQTRHQRQRWYGTAATSRSIQVALTIHLITSRAQNHPALK